MWVFSQSYRIKSVMVTRKPMSLTSDFLIFIVSKHLNQMRGYSVLIWLYMEEKYEDYID